MYEIVIMLNGVKQIHRLTDCAWIPEDITNADYRAYLQWVSEGNVAPEVHTPSDCVLS